MVLKHKVLLVFNEAPNKNDTAHNSNVCLTTMGTQQFSMAAI